MEPSAVSQPLEAFQRDPKKLTLLIILPPHPRLIPQGEGINGTALTLNGNPMAK